MAVYRLRTQWDITLWPSYWFLHSPPQTHKSWPCPRKNHTKTLTHRISVRTVLQIDSLAVSCETWSIRCITIILPARPSPLPGRVTWHLRPADWCVWVRVWRVEYQSSSTGISRSVQQQQHYSDPSPEPNLIWDLGPETVLARQKDNVEWEVVPFIKKTRVSQELQIFLYLLALVVTYLNRKVGGVCHIKDISFYYLKLTLLLVCSVANYVWVG